MKTQNYTKSRDSMTRDDVSTSGKAHLLFQSVKWQLMDQLVNQLSLDWQGINPRNGL